MRSLERLTSERVHHCPEQSSGVSETTDKGWPFSCEWLPGIAIHGLIDHWAVGSFIGRINTTHINLARAGGVVFRSWGRLVFHIIFDFNHSWGQ
jgi:hypothetical protein